MTTTIHIGDCRDVLKTLPEKPVHCCVTSPPYWNLRTYLPKDHPDKQKELGLEKTPEEYVTHLVEIMDEVKRVLRDDGTLWLNLSSSYSGSGKGIGSDHGKAVFSDENIPKTNWIKTGFKPQELIPIPWLAALELRKHGWRFIQDIIWEKPNCMPESVKKRCTKSHEYLLLFSKSKNYFYDNDAVKEPCSESNIKDFKNRKTLDNKGTFGNVRADLGRSRTDYMPSDFMRNKRSGWSINTKPYKGAHFAVMPSALVEPCIKAGTSEIGVCSVCGSPFVRVTEKTGYSEHGGYRKRADAPGAEVSESSVFRTGLIAVTQTVGFKPSCSCYGSPEFPDYPPTVNEEADLELIAQIRSERTRLLKQFDLLTTIPATVLDPFGGSGTAGEVCKSLNRNSILIELNPDYKELIEKRIGV